MTLLRASTFVSLSLLLAAAPSVRADTSAATTAATLKPSAAKETAPATFKVKMVTTKGDFTIEVHRDWAPVGADRFYNLGKMGYFPAVAFFRVVKGFMVQFGIHGDPAVARQWES